MKLAPNLEWFFKDLPYVDRIAKVADMGFKGGDFFGVENKNPTEIARVCEKYGFTITMVVGASLDKSINDVSLHASLEKQVREKARALRDMRGTNLVIGSGNRLPRVPDSAQNQAIIDGLKRLAPIADEFGITLVLEILNSRYDHPGYYLDDTELMINLLRAVNHPRVKGLYDIYHAGIMRGNIIEDIRSSIAWIGHFHVAGIPGRNEPKDGEQNYPAICRAIDKTGYQGFIGLEYTPLKDSYQSLDETKNWIENG
jgi:hydroxypyruvate isomerase